MCQRSWIAACGAEAFAQACVCGISGQARFCFICFQVIRVEVHTNLASLKADPAVAEGVGMDCTPVEQALELRLEAR